MRAVWLGLLVACEGAPPDDTSDPDVDRDGVPADVDCDDADADVGGPTVWAGDCDADGAAGDVVSDPSCAPPATPPCEGGAWVSTPTGQDCDDADADAISPATWYVDCDGDGALADAGASCGPPDDPCDGDVVPAEVTEVAPADLDCDDTDPGVAAPATGSDCEEVVVVEDCAAVGDEEHDGLADCEDDECARAAGCAELACSDDQDDDADGDVDCADPDCWGHGCAVTAVRFTRGQVTRTGRREVRYWTCYNLQSSGYSPITTSSNFTTIQYHGALAADEVQGEIRRYTVSGHVGDCAFSVPHAGGEATVDPTSAPTPTVAVPIARERVDLVGDCGVAFSDIAPDSYLFVRADAGPLWNGHFEGGAAPTWYPPGPTVPPFVRSSVGSSSSNNCRSVGGVTDREPATWTVGSTWIVIED